MKIRPKLAFRHANYPTITALDPTKVYEAIPATNQPDWQDKGKVFVNCPNGAPELMLERDDYEVVIDPPYADVVPGFELRDDLPHNSNDHPFITTAVRRLPTPQHASISVDGSPRLNVTYHDGENVGLRVSKRVAEVLIALGFNYQG